MPTHLRLKPKQIAIALAVVLGAMAPTWATSSGEGSATVADGRASESQPAVDVAESAKTETPAAAPVTNTASYAKPAESSMESEMQELRDLLEAQARQLQAQSEQLQEQQQKMMELEASLRNPAAEPESPAVPAESAIAPVSISAPIAPAAQAGPDLGKRIDNLEKRLGAFGPFSFAGDFRLRDEPYFGGPINSSQVRDRERYRARFYINAKLNDDISGGLGLSTGDPNDPITSNQTANQFFTRKPFMLDRAFIVYTPHEFKALTLTGGKFAYPWYRTQLTWDDDINPEGVAEKLEWHSDKWHVLRQFALIGFELPFAETQNTEAIKTYTQPANALLPYPTSSVHQSVVYGGQIQTRWQLASWLSFTADTAFYNWHNADPIALANLEGYGNATASSPGVGLYTINNTLTNSYQAITATYTAAGTSGTTPGTITVDKYIVAAKLNSKFALSDSIAQFDIKTPSARWPIRLLADYVQNTEACANDTPLTLTTAQKTALATANLSTATTNGACNSHARRANWLESRFGRQQEKGDWQFAYTHMLIEREAVISIFDFSDIRQGSDVQQNRVEALYEANRNVQLGFTGYFGRPLHPAVTTPAEGTLKRLQFDVVYKF